MIPYGRAMAKEAALAEADFIKALDELLDAFLKLPYHWAVDLGVPCSPQSSLFQKWRDKVDIKPIGCIAGKSSMTILASGEAVPCVCMEDKSFSCGNIKNMALSELWESPAMSLFRGEIVIPSCESCPSRQFCLGGCRTLACLISKQPHGPDPMCPYWKLS
jgi:radical SAM protein with 4Fe4S-binding SPASM domain